MTGWFLLAALLLLIANAFFVAVEFALLASRVTRLEPMAEDDDRRAAIALASIKDLQSQLAGAQLDRVVPGAARALRAVPRQRAARAGPRRGGVGGGEGWG